ncbi:2-keto-4-pentenoate hydratase/2-oxohepta-3-ene-1,7-dioic acid hydratase in catechol pathway [Rhodoligotrophos appendicifer]|uniref:fumarylacetoacetate hydrolase family protein n=1 Tax=Rhodoligotrophos appendicifer TaxID=987056 RepID=UPI00117C14DF|nr:fumarylacetoacetate hydrolase family protein [Rhodoligotrophos appendicifer]
MKLVTCEPKTSDQSSRFLAAAVSEDVFIDLRSVDSIIHKDASGDRIPNDIIEMISNPGRYYPLAEEVIRFAKGSPDEINARAASKVAWRKSELRFLPTIPRPGKILHTSVNFSDHKKEVASAFKGDAWKAQDWGSFHYQHPTGFLQAPSSTVGTEEAIYIPSFTEQLDYEIELAIVIGKKAKNVSKENALDYVAGYCVFNDVSARDIQSREHANKVILLGKSFDTSCPLGPWLTTIDEIADPQDLKMTLRLNGEIRQDSSTKNMVFGVADLVSWWSNITLEPGDVITSGSPSGVIAGHANPVWLAPGDRIEATIAGLGQLVNTVAALPA